MKKTAPLYLLFIVILITCIYNIQQNSNLKTELEKIKSQKNVSASVNQEDEELEVAHFMNRIQNYHQKLYFSGVAENLELVKFYLHELEEEMESISNAGIVKDGVNISNAMRSIGLKQIENFEKEIESKTYNFANSFEQLTLSCNSCHQATRQQAIKIIIPLQNSFTNQSFSKD